MVNAESCRRVAALYDIHGNLPALEAVLGEVRHEGVELVVVGGDVFPGPLASECLTALLGCGLPLRFLRGNGDRETLALARGGDGAGLPAAVREVIRWGAERLTPAEIDQLASWPASLELVIEGLGSVLFCHATPASDTTIITCLSPEDVLCAELAAVAAEVVVCGHTHMQFTRRVPAGPPGGGTQLVNAGSVGMPFGEAGAYWLRLGPGIALRRTVYDLEAAAARLRASAYPQAAAFAAGNVLSPPSETEMLARLGGAPR